MLTHKNTLLFLYFYVKKFLRHLFLRTTCGCIQWIDSFFFSWALVYPEKLHFKTEFAIVTVPKEVCSEAKSEVAAKVS